jgi:D-lactate dehydrogenase
MKTWRDKYEHHLLLKMAGDGIEEAQAWLTEFFKPPKAISLPVRRKKAAKLSCTALPPRVRRSAIRRFIR